MLRPHKSVSRVIVVRLALCTSRDNYPLRHATGPCRFPVCDVISLCPLAWARSRHQLLRFNLAPCVTYKKCATVPYLIPFPVWTRAWNYSLLCCKLLWYFALFASLMTPPSFTFFFVLSLPYIPLTCSFFLSWLVSVSFSAVYCCEL